VPTIAAPAPGEAIRSGTVATAAGATAAIGERVTLADLIRMTTDKQREAKREASRRRRAAEHAAFGRHAGGDEDEETMQTGDAAATLGLAAGPLTIPVDANGNDIVLPRQNAIPRAPPGVANAVVSQPTAPPPIALPMAPQVHVVNGRLVVNQHSLTVVQPSGGGGGGPSAGAVALVGGAGALSAPAHYSNGYANRMRVDKWSTQDTALFYRALSQFGTDFSLIERLFPGRTRRQIKNKFTSEEKVAPQKVDAALRDRTGSGGTGAGGTTSVQALRDMIDSLRKSQAEEQARQERLQQAAIAAAAKQASDAAAAEQAAQGERDRQVAAAKESRREAAHARAAAAPPVVPSGAAAVAVPPPPPVVKARGQPKNASVVNAVLPKKVQRKQRANLLAEEDDDCGPAPAPAVAAPEVAHQAQAATAAVRPGKARDMPERLLHGRDAVEAGQQAIRNALAGRV
jgi:transcription factor TFIIIB component B''